MHPLPQVRHRRAPLLLDRVDWVRPCPVRQVVVLPQGRVLRLRRDILGCDIHREEGHAALTTEVFAGILFRWAEGLPAVPKPRRTRIG